MGHVDNRVLRSTSPSLCAAIDCVTISPRMPPSRLQFRDKFYPSHLEVSKSHFAAVHVSGIGTFETCRPPLKMYCSQAQIGSDWRMIGARACVAWSCHFHAPVRLRHRPQPRWRGKACEQHRQNAGQEYAVKCPCATDGSDRRAKAADLVEIENIGAD